MTSIQGKRGRWGCGEAREKSRQAGNAHPLIVSNEIVSEILKVPDTSASDVLTDNDDASIDCTAQ